LIVAGKQTGIAECAGRLDGSVGNAAFLTRGSVRGDVLRTI
jgi:hypothetical protein